MLGFVHPRNSPQGDARVPGGGQRFKKSETAITGSDTVILIWDDAILVKIPMRTLTALVYKEEGVYVAECPEVGTASQGDTIEEAVANLKEATELYLEESPLETRHRPILTTFEVADGIQA